VSGWECPKCGSVCAPFTDSPDGPAFSDEDLAKYRAYVEKYWPEHEAAMLAALIARLEASEGLARWLAEMYPGSPLVKAWRKSAGK
jgi:cell division inhibitor SulA